MSGEKYCIELTSDFFENITPYQNLMFNLMSGLEIEHLTAEEIQLLRNEHGEDWKKKLGYE